jgi:2-polyprenyl-3-methyl-5-hydroxy-6-metoxy-1,4-benzoquinol methylase
LFSGWCEVSFKLTKIVRALKGRGPELVVASAEFLPFRSNSFNCILCTEVLEHLRRLKLATHEIKRVLKNDGISIVSVPNFQDFTPLWLLLQGIGVNPLLVWRIAAKIFLDIILKKLNVMLLLMLPEKHLSIPSLLKI